MKTQNVLQMNANDLCEDKEDLFNTSDEQIREISQPIQSLAMLDQIESYKQLCEFVQSKLEQQLDEYKQLNVLMPRLKD